jgi:hypothetical protein
VTAQAGQRPEVAAQPADDVAHPHRARMHVGGRIARWLSDRAAGGPRQGNGSPPESKDAGA